MGLGALFILAVGLSMDAFAVSICKGLALRRITVKNATIVGLWFGGFQALMPFLGYSLGVQFSDEIRAVDHWVAFGLLILIGANMIREAFSSKEEEADASLSFHNMLLLAIATSIDALAIGVTFAFLQVNIYLAIAFIGITTFIISVFGVKIGSIFGTKYKARAEFAGGAILILLGLKILFEHLELL